MPRLIMLRHGKSAWNKQNRFTGWVDVELDADGIEQARNAGRLLQKHGLEFEVVFTSYLRRAVRTLWEVLDVTDKMWMPVMTDWRLNERHYGDLQGKDKDETREQFGAEQVQIWRRSYETPPPPAKAADDCSDGRYDGVAVPTGESLKLTLERVMPCWEERIRPELAAGRDVLLVAHGNSLRSLVKHLDGMGEDEIMAFEIATGVPLVYELEADLSVASRRFLEK